MNILASWIFTLFWIENNTYVFQPFNFTSSRWTKQLGWKLAWFRLQAASLSLPFAIVFFFFRRSTFLSGFCWRMLCSCGYKLPFSPYHLDIWTPKPRFKAWHRFSPLGVHRVFSSSSFLFVGPVFFFLKKILCSKHFFVGICSGVFEMCICLCHHCTWRFQPIALMEGELQIKWCVMVVITVIVDLSITWCWKSNNLMILCMKLTFQNFLLLMAEILHHLGRIKPCK